MSERIDGPYSPIALPSLALNEWEPTKDTLHRYAQIVGKIRLWSGARRNHWWNVTLYVSSRGLTTGPNPYGDETFEVFFDFVAHELRVAVSTGATFSFTLEDGMSVADFYRELLAGLGALGIEVAIDPTPYHIGGDPFDQDATHVSYDKGYAARYWRILVQVDQIFKEFSGRFNGKTSPVHLFWHGFDLAVTRFSGRRAPERERADKVTREAYSHEVISFGFWPGDRNTPAPAFYSYTAPEPEGLTRQPLRPEAAFWAPEGGMALLMYYDLRRAHSPKTTLLEFMESAYQAGARTASWDVEDLRTEPAR